MPHINWLHLSDWHQRGEEFDRRVIAKKLIDDIKTRSEIELLLENIDFIVFSGDISFSGEREQFELAYEQLIKPVQEIVGKKLPICFAPGNHDIKRSAFLSIPAEMTKTLAGKNRYEIEQLLQDHIAIQHLNRPLQNFYDFANKLGSGFNDRKLFSTRVLKKNGRSIGIACLNTTWLSARFSIQQQHEEQPQEFWDRGLLRMTEAQIRDALEELGNTEVTIVVMHHPFDWLEEADQARAEQLIGRYCHIVLHGHGHRPNMNRLSNAYGDLVIISAGASYNRRNPADPRYTNAYNFCSVDLDTKEGTLFHRIWSEDTDTWRADERFWAEGRSTFSIHKEQPSQKERIVRSALNQLSKSPLRNADLNKRVATFNDTTMRHQAQTIDGETFIKCTGRIRIGLSPGDHERFPIKSLANARIVAHPNPHVHANAFRLLNLTPNPSELLSSEDGVQYQAYLDLGPNEQDIEYKYEMLETTDGLYYFNLRRFTERVRFTLFTEPSLQYEYLSFGGFPAAFGRRLADPNDPFSALIWETNEAATPNQGFLVQWYPKLGPTKA